MNPALVVVRPFAAYGPGAVITDPKEVACVLADERAANVVRVVLPSTAATASPPAAQPPAVSPPAHPSPAAQPSPPAASQPAAAPAITQTIDKPAKES